MIEQVADRNTAIEAMRANQRAKRRAEASELQYAALIADLYSDLDDPSYLLPGCEKLMRLGADGTPSVAEFCTLELAAALGLRDETVVELMSDALDIRHRLPNLWRLVDELDVPVWQARQVARMTSELDQCTCAIVDARLATRIVGMPWTRFKSLLSAWLLELLPPEQAARRRAEALDRRHIGFTPAVDGVAEVHGCLSGPDAILLDAQLDRFASILHTGGRTGTHETLRADAVGVLANPALALQMAQASFLDELPADPDEFDECFRRGGAGHTCGAITVDPDKLLPKAQLVVHLSDATLMEGEGLLRIPRLGPALAEWAHELLGHRRVVVRPVVDVNTISASDCYEAPDTMREAVTHRNEFEAFPWSTKRSGRCDLDHTEPFVRGGPPGQTRPDNLLPLSRKVHRAKTHGGFHVDQLAPRGGAVAKPAGAPLPGDPESHDRARSTTPRPTRCCGLTRLPRGVGPLACPPADWMRSAVSPGPDGG